jgi:serine/threonine protein kinase
MNDTHVMSGKTGNMLLMAPEVWHQQPYNEKADVYSFAIVLWIILVLDLLPFRELLGSDTAVFTKRVMIQGQRPPIPQKWPKYIQLLLCQAWSKDMIEQPTMNEICLTLTQQQYNSRTSTTTTTTTITASDGGRKGHRRHRRLCRRLVPTACFVLQWVISKRRELISLRRLSCV